MLIGSITALLAALLALLLAERIAQPMRQLSDLTESLKQGDLRTVLIPSPDDEVGQLIQAMVQTFEQIQGRVTSLSTVLDQVADGVLVTEEDGKISLINATAARLIGIEKDAALECSFVEVMPNQPLVDLWRRCGERSDIQGTKVEFDHDGLILQAIVTPFTDESSAGCLVILQDLTNARRQESSRSELIGNISHVLRFSLSRLKTVVDALHSDGDNKLLAVIEYKNRLDDEIGNLSNIAEELLEISRLESRTASLILSPISVAEVVIPPMDRLKPEAKLAGLELTVLLPPDIPQVLADVDRARLALANVVHNAVKFTPPGGTISVVVQPAGGEVLFTVQDNGVGIPAEDLLRVFEWSYQADGAEGGDIDMGLAIAKQIVQGHSGRIWAESIEFQGSTFFFTLPVAGER
jgi:two-component system phosphate regulon sensor histidine kinase PhoR